MLIIQLFMSKIMKYIINVKSLVKHNYLFLPFLFSKCKLDSFYVPKTVRDALTVWKALI